jgi:hypothetical protein
VKISLFAVVAVLSVVPLAGCGSDGDSDAEAKPSRSGKPETQNTNLLPGEAYAYGDGLAVTVVKAAKAAPSNADPGETPFRLHLKFENKGKAPIDLDDFAMFVSAANNSGAAESTFFDDSDTSDRMTGPIAPGATANRTQDFVIRSKHDNRLTVELQYASYLSGQLPRAVVTIR